MDTLPPQPQHHPFWWLSPVIEPLPVMLLGNLGWFEGAAEAKTWGKSLLSDVGIVALCLALVSDSENMLSSFGDDVFPAAVMESRDFYFQLWLTFLRCRMLLKWWKWPSDQGTCPAFIHTDWKLLDTALWMVKAVSLRRKCAESKPWPQARFMKRWLYLWIRIK